MASDESDSFVVEDSEDEGPMVPWKKKIQNQRNEDSGDEIIPDSDEDVADSNDDDEDEQAGRLTPVIQRAIRRSIFNMSRQSSGSEDEEVASDEDGKLRHSSKSFEASDSEEEKVKVSKRRNNHRKSRLNKISSDSSSNDDGSLNSTNNDSGSDEPRRKSSGGTEYTLRTSTELSDSRESLPSASINISNSPGTVKPRIQDSSDEVEELPPPSKSKSPTEIISIESDEHLDASDEHSMNKTAAIFMAQEEIGFGKIDPLLAQKRAMLVFEIQKIEVDLRKINTFLVSGQTHLLPDGGEKLRKSAAENEAKLMELRRKLSECRLVEPDSPSRSQGSLSPVKSPVNQPSQLDDGALREQNPFPAFDAGNLGQKALETLHREQAVTLDTLKSFHGSLESRPADDAQAEDPNGLKVSLMPHQKHALAWLTWREHQKPPGGVLADDMGLGKTLTMISLVLKSNEREDSGEESEEEWQNTKNRTSKLLGGTLVVCPASLIGQWEEEVKRRCRRGLLNVEVYHGNKRETVAKRLARNDMVITTYHLISREHKMNGVVFKIQWKRIILDEGHVIRNHKSQICEGICALSGFKRWVLTGTPVQNKEIDLFAVLKFLQCSPFNDIRVWKRWVDNKNQAGLDRLATVMKTLMLRRTKQELMNTGAIETLPEKFFEVTWVDLDVEERLVYDKVMLHSRTIFAQFLEQRAAKEQMFRLGAGTYFKNTKNPFTKAQQKLLAQHATEVASSQILILLLRLRQICCHPSLIKEMLDREDIEENAVDEMDNASALAGRMESINLQQKNEESNDEDDGPALVSERVTEDLLTSSNPIFNRQRVSSKLQAVLDLVEKIYESDDKVIIVSQWTGVLEIIAEYLKKNRKDFTKLTGAVQVKNRGQIVDNFNYEKSPKILLLSLTAGGVGLNLVGANHLILVDVHWNPQLESQAQDRIYRFGQKKNVFIYKFLCKDTIEERIKNMQDKKLELADNILSGSGKAAVSAKLTLDDLKSLFGF